MAHLTPPDLAATRSAGIGTAARRYGFVMLGTLVMMAPVASEVASVVWTTDQGAQGPLILATGAWLLWIRAHEGAALARPGSFASAAVALVACGLLFVFARAVDMLSLQILCGWLVLAVLLYAYLGPALLRRLAFPLGYLLFLIPPPFFIAWPVVQALKLWIASHSVAIAAAAGLEVAHQGSSLFVDGYELSVEAACAGLNSLFSLLAIGALYIHLRHPGDRRRAAALAAAIVPLAIAANMIRVLVLVAAVHRFGVAVLDTPVHVTTGLLMALAAMALLVLLDALLTVAAHRTRVATA